LLSFFTFSYRGNLLQQEAEEILDIFSELHYCLATQPTYIHKHNTKPQPPSLLLKMLPTTAATTSKRRRPRVASPPPASPPPTATATSSSSSSILLADDLIEHIFTFLSLREHTYLALFLCTHKSAATASPWTRVAHADEFWKIHIFSRWPSWGKGLLPLFEARIQPPLPLCELFARRMHPEKMFINEPKAKEVKEPQYSKDECFEDDDEAVSEFTTITSSSSGKKKGGGAAAAAAAAEMPIPTPARDIVLHIEVREHRIYPVKGEDEVKMKDYEESDEEEEEEEEPEEKEGNTADQPRRPRVPPILYSAILPYADPEAFRSGISDEDNDHLYEPQTLHGAVVGEVALARHLRLNTPPLSCDKDFRLSGSLVAIHLPTGRMVEWIE
jgi:hypothetical protein